MGSTNTLLDMKPPPGQTSRRVLAVLWLTVGAALVLIPVWVGLTRWQVILSGDPFTLALTIVCAALGIVALAWAIGTLAIGAAVDGEDEQTHVQRTPKQLRRRAAWRLRLGVPALIICLLLAATLAYIRPFAASAGAVYDARTSENVRIVDRLTWFEMVPERKTDAGERIVPTTGLVFSPGARVDPRAYATVLRPLAEAGYFVAVLKVPLGLSLIDGGQSQQVLDNHPEITHWAVGGHSLGGVSASSFADSTPAVDGLVLFASFPISKMKRTDLKVLSVSASLDGLSTPAKVEASKADLPTSTTYVVVDGAVHAFFGDYGPQPGDGTPTADRAVAQAEITKATQTFLASLTPKKK